MIASYDYTCRTWFICIVVSIASYDYTCSCVTLLHDISTYLLLNAVYSSYSYIQI